MGYIAATRVQKLERGAEESRYDDIMFVISIYRYIQNNAGHVGLCALQAGLVIGSNEFRYIAYIVVSQINV